MATNTNGSYNGFQAGVRLQNKWGLSGEVDYTWSHEIDIQTNDNSCCTSNPWNFKYDKGGGGFDRRQILFQLHVQAAHLQQLAGSGQIDRRRLGVSGTFTAETGVPTPLTFTNGGDPIGLGGGYTNRPNVTGKMHYTEECEGLVQHLAGFAIRTASWLGGSNLGFGSSGKDAVGIAEP